MEILPIYLNKQMETCKKAGLDPTMIYLLNSIKGEKIPEKDWQSVNINSLNGLEGLVPFLQSVEETKLLIEPKVYRDEANILEQIKGYTNNKTIGDVVSRALRNPSWRERATIMNLTTKMFEGKLDRQYIEIATAVELVQEAFMLQDDVLDGQERCVNRETVPSLYGISRANLAKDLILAKAGDDLRDNLEKKIIVEGMRLVEEMLKNDTLGQWIDIESEQVPYMEEDKYYQMIALTPGTQFQNITHLAYLLADKNNKRDINYLRKFGLNLGMAAQLRDDIIDVIGDEETVYKKLGTDVARGKKRLPLIKYLEENPQDKVLFEKKIDEENAQRILENMRNKSNALPYCVSKVRSLINEGTKYLEALDCKEKEILIQTAGLVSNFDGY